MGTAKAWEDTAPTKALPFRDWCQQFVEEHGNKPPRIALDMSNHIYQVSMEKNSQGEGIEHTQLARRLLAFIASGCALVCVFDGPMAPEKRRHAGSTGTIWLRQNSPMVKYAKKLVRALQIPALEAPSEAEAQCAALQRSGKVDVVFSSDADILANGATRILRYEPLTAGSGAASRMVLYYEIGLDEAPVYAMKALLLGNDWSEGVPGIGIKIAGRICHQRTGFARRLAEVSAGADPKESLEELRIWKLELTEELRTNQHGWLTQKCNLPLPISFPNLGVLNMLLRPDVRDPGTYTSQLAGIGDGTSRAVVSLLKSIWFQPSPSYRPPAASENSPIDEETMARLLRSFQSAVAPAIVASLLVRDAVELQQLEFKGLNHERDLEVVSCTLPDVAGLTFLIGARVPAYLGKDRSSLRLAQKPAPKAVRTNSTLDKFLRYGMPEAVRSSSGPASEHLKAGAAKRTTSLPSCMDAPGDNVARQQRSPLQPLKYGGPNSVTKASKSKSLATTTMGPRSQPARRFRSKLVAAETDSRVDDYFKPFLLERLATAVGDAYDNDDEESGTDVDDDDYKDDADCGAAFSSDKGFGESGNDTAIIDGVSRGRSASAIAPL